MKTLQTIFLALLLSTFSSAYAGEAYESCLEKFGTMNNTVVHGCSSEVSDQLKKEMNKLYDIVYKKISDQSKDDAKKFEQSQKTWLKFRQSHCELMGSYVGSPMYSVCPMEQNASRVYELSVLAE